MAMQHSGGNVTPYHGDHHPVSVYQGREDGTLDTIYSPATSTDSGTAPAFDNTYNHSAEVSVAGKSEQVQYAGKNLYDVDRCLISRCEGGYYSDNGDGTITEITAGDGVGWAILLDDSISISIPAGTYTASVDVVSCSSVASPKLELKWGDASSTIGSCTINLLSTNTGTFTVSQDCRLNLKLYDDNYKVSTNWITFKNVQLEKGSTATSYEPYCGGIPSPNPDYPQEIVSISYPSITSTAADGRTSTVTIDLQGNELRSLPDGTKDELVVHRDGTVELVQRVYAYKITDTECYWGGSAYGKYSIAIKLPPDDVVVLDNNVLNNRFVSTRFKFSNNNVHGTLKYENGTTSQGVRYKNIYHLFEPDVVSSLAAGKAWFAENETFEQIALATPVTTTLGTIDPIPTYHPYTAFSANGLDITAIVKVIE